MKKLNLFVLSLLSGVSGLIAKHEVQKQAEKLDSNENEKYVSPGRNLFRQMQKLHEDFNREMKEFFQSMHDDFFAENAKSEKEVTNINVSKENDKDGNELIVITVNLADKQARHNDIKIKAKGNNLEGIVEYNDRTFKFFVINGIEFGTVLEYKQEFNKDEKDKKQTKFMSSVSAQVETIPPVSNLEKTKASIQDGTLTIKLPSRNSKQDWADIYIEKNKTSNKLPKNPENLK